MVENRRAFFVPECTDSQVGIPQSLKSVKRVLKSFFEVSGDFKSELEAVKPRAKNRERGSQS